MSHSSFSKILFNHSVLEWSHIHKQTCSCICDLLVYTSHERVKGFNKFFIEIWMHFKEARKRKKKILLRFFRFFWWYHTVSLLSAFYAFSFLCCCQSFLEHVSHICKILKIGWQPGNYRITRMRNSWFTSEFHSWWVTSPTGNYMFKINNRNTRRSCEICSRLTIKTPELALVFLLLTLSR